jgi:hypothetical protein
VRLDDPNDGPDRVQVLGRRIVYIFSLGDGKQPPIAI